jgi:hypothetical protein
VLDSKGHVEGRTRVNHRRGAIRNFRSKVAGGTSRALESIGKPYRIVNEIEEASAMPFWPARLVEVGT